MREIDDLGGRVWKEARQVDTAKRRIKVIVMSNMQRRAEHTRQHLLARGSQIF
jgi:hypothetical protein